MSNRQQDQRVHSLRDKVDFVIIGSGAAGGIMAKELSIAGFSVVVLEQGPYMKPHQFMHDEFGGFEKRGLGARSGGEDDPQTFRESEKEETEIRQSLNYLRMVGGTQTHFTANSWRFHEIDFKERSIYGPVEGTEIEDWPITYEELEPYYTKVDWEFGISGEPGPHDPPRSRHYPMPPLPVKSSGVIFEKAAKKLGWNPYPAPMAILSRPHNGRPSCVHCGFCMGFGCEVSAKSTSLSAMIPLAERSGKCEIRPNSTVYRIETNDAGIVNEVIYFEQNGNLQGQLAKAVVLCANGAETPRTLLMSESSRFPNGLANSSGKVGKYIMGNGQVHAYALFDKPLNEYKSIMVTRVAHDFYDSDSSRGFFGGGGMDARWQYNPISFALKGLPPDAPTWGSDYKRMIKEYFNYTIDINGHTTMIPMESNYIDLDPELKDKYGRPAIRKTFKEHPDDVKIREFFLEKCIQLVEATNALKTWHRPVEAKRGHTHLLGTCRMGNDLQTSVVDKYHRSHDVPNLFICDGSSFVSSGRGQPTMTIQALAFRAAEHIIQFARKGEI